MSGTVCAAVNPKLGRTGLCDDKAMYGKPKQLLFNKFPAFHPTEADFILQATWNTAIKAENVFPLAFDDLTMADIEAGTYTSGVGTVYKTTERKHILVVKTNAAQCLKSEIIKLEKFKGRVYIAYDSDYLRGCQLETGKVSGLRVEKILYMGEMMQGTDSDTPSQIELRIILKSAGDVDRYEYAQKMTSWSPEDLDGIHYATIENVSDSSSSIVVDLKILCGGDYVPIEGFTAVADWVSTCGTINTGGVAESTTIPGRYTITPSTTFATGTIDIAATSALTYASFFLASAGAATVTI